jgi:hypothetical protein
MKRHYNYFAEKLGLKKGISPPSPPYSSLPTPRRFYSGPCPIGEQGAPQLKDPGYTSGALCRGACGSDCPPNRCTETDEVISLPIEGGTCYYSNVVKCPTHKGCRDHDCCYDWCSELGETDITGVCHSECNQRCYNEYGRVNCTAWSNLPAAPVNFISSTGGAVVDWVTGPEYDGELIFSDPPVFYPSEETCTLCKGKDVCYYALEPFDAQNPPWRSDDGRAYVEFHPKGDFFNMDGEPYVVIHNFPSKRPCPPPDDLVIEDELWYKVDKEGNIHHYDTVLGKVTCSEVTFTYKWSECCGSLGPKLSCSTGWIEGETTQRFAYYGE